MHEASIAQGILYSALAETPPNAEKIVAVTVVVGVLTGVEKSCLTSYFTELARGTKAQGARLDIKIACARLICRQCGLEIEFDGAGPVEPTCRACGQANKLEGGEEMHLESLEVKIS